jgi:glycerophosphoryl diester phosphodiesterase
MANDKLVVAHRGGSSKWRENTVDAVRHAIDCGADMVEFDVRRTADGELIVHHEEALGDCLLADIDCQSSAPVGGAGAQSRRRSIADQYR